MTISALEYVKEQAKKEFPNDGFSVEDYFDQKDVIHTEVYNESRWWSDTEVVVDSGGVLISYSGAETTGDDSPGDKGWEFDESTVSYSKVETKMVAVTTYSDSDSPMTNPIKNA